MEYVDVKVTFNHDEYELLKAFCDFYHIALEDGLLAAAIIRGIDVGFDPKVLEIRWKLFFWGKVLKLKSTWMPGSEDVVRLQYYWNLLRKDV